MASLITCCVTSASWCFCQACTSLLCACCGNDKASTVPPSATSGRKRSVFLLVLAVGCALGFQYGVAPYLVDSSISNYISDAWLDGCDHFEDDGLKKSCSGNNGNYRAFSAAFLFFLIAAVAAGLKPTANREAWPAKYVLFLFLVAVTVFIPNKPLFADIFLNVARIGGAIFILFQQFIIVDMAYNWNDSWVSKSNEAETEEVGSGRKWLTAILLSCLVLYAFCIGALVYMFIEFTGCPSNATFISLTLIFCILIHAAQLSGEEGSLLSSSVVSAWAVFLCYTAVAKNPNQDCNPNVGEADRASVALGLIVMILSLGWAGWSYTAEDKLTMKSNSETSQQQEEQKDEEQPGEDRKVTGVVTGSYQQTDEEGGANENDEEDAPGANDPKKLSNSWRLNIALAAVGCWASMVLTHWGEIRSNGNLANASAGRISMWIVIASQWVALSLYLWTLVAPRLFPNRDFS